MLPKIVTITELRKNISKILEMTDTNIIVVKGKKSNKVIIDEKYYNYLSSLADQFAEEDPEGEYKEKFVKEMLGVMKNPNIDPNIKSLKDLL